MADGNLLKCLLVNDTSCVGFLALKRSYCSFNIFFLHIYMITHAESGLSLIESVFILFFKSYVGKIRDHKPLVCGLHNKNRQIKMDLYVFCTRSLD